MDLFHLIQAGGWMLLPLFVCSVLVIAIFIERFRYYRASRSDFSLLSEKIPEYLDRDDFTGLQDCLKKDGGLPASVLLPAASRPGSRNRQEEMMESTAVHTAESLKQNLNYLDTIVTLAPLMGLLGTVLAMMKSFRVLSGSGSQPFAITGGVAESLICTAAGLFVAILALIAYTILSQQANRLISQTERLASLYLSFLKEEK